MKTRHGVCDFVSVRALTNNPSPALPSTSGGADLKQYDGSRGGNPPVCICGDVGVLALIEISVPALGGDSSSALGKIPGSGADGRAELKTAAAESSIGAVLADVCGIDVAAAPISAAGGGAAVDVVDTLVLGAPLLLLGAWPQMCFSSA